MAFATRNNHNHDLTYKVDDLFRGHATITRTAPCLVSRYPRLERCQPLLAPSPKNSHRHTRDEIELSWIRAEQHLEHALAREHSLFSERPYEPPIFPGYRPEVRADERQLARRGPGPDCPPSGCTVPVAIVSSLDLGSMSSRIRSDGGRSRADRSQCREKVCARSRSCHCPVAPLPGGRRVGRPQPTAFELFESPRRRPATPALPTSGTLVILARFH